MKLPALSVIMLGFMALLRAEGVAWRETLLLGLCIGLAGLTVWRR